MCLWVWFIEPMLWLLLGKGRGSKEATSVWAHLGLSHPHSILSTSYWFVKTTKEPRRFSKIAVPNKILKNTSKFIWRPKESIYETLKRWYHAGARDATWKGFPVVILMPYAYQHSSHPAFSRRPSWNKSESLFFQMSTQFSTQTNSSKPVTICGFVIVKNPSSSQVDQSIWWGLLADLRAERMQRKIHGAGAPAVRKTLAPRTNERPEKINHV